MPTPAISKASIKKTSSLVDKDVDPSPSEAFIEKLEKIVSDTEGKGRARVIQVSEISEREVFEIFKLANPYRDWGMLRSFAIPELKTKPYTQALKVPTQARDILESIAKTWPPFNEFNVRILITMIIHFAIVQINEEIQSGHRLDPQSSSPSPSPLSPSPKTPQERTESNSPSEPIINLQAHTGVPVSFATTTPSSSSTENITLRGYIDYGLSSASEEALATFFPIVQAKAIGKLNAQTWAQLLCYMCTYTPSFRFPTPSIHPSLITNLISAYLSSNYPKAAGR